MITFGYNTDREWTPERIAALSKSLGLLIAGGIGLGLFAIAAQLYYIAAAVAVCLLVLLVAWRFESVLMLYLLVAFVPWGQTPDLAVGGSGVGKGLYVSQAMLGFLLIIWFVRYLAGALPGDRIRTAFYVPIGLYLAYSILNVAHSFLFWDTHVSKVHQHLAVNLVEIGLRFLSAGALVMVATTVSSRGWLKWTTFAIMAPGLYNLLNTLTGGHIPVAAPWWPLVALLPVGFGFAVALDPYREVWKRLLGFALVAAALAATLVLGVAWVSGWLATIVCLLTILFFRSRKAFVWAIVVLVLAGAVAEPFVYEKVVLESKESGDLDRFALLLGGWKYATSFPLGVGLGNYRTYNTFYYGDLWGTTSYSSAHGTYSQHLAEMGIPGLVLFLAILVGGFRWVLRGYNEIAESFSRTYLLATLGQMAGISAAAFVGDYIIPAYHNGGLVTFSATCYSWLIWGLAAAHIRLSRNT